MNESGDRLETEADHTAKQVVNKDQTPKSYVPSLAPVQLKEKDEEQQLVQEKPLAASITPVVMRSEVSGYSGEMAQGDASIDKQLRSSKGSGTQLSTAVRSEMEAGFGTNFNDVRVHTDKRAVSMNQQIGAQAFTNGNDIYFNEGKFNPANKEGKFLLAHELTHTIQQNGGESAVQRTGDDPVVLTSPLFQLAAFESVMKGELVIGRKNNGDAGSSGTAVKHINSALALLYPDVEEKLLKDAQSYSKWTVKTVKRFQKEHGISVDGNVGKQTLLVLDAYHFQESVDQITYQANLRGKVQYIDDKNWTKADSNGQFLQIISGTKHYIIPTEEIAYKGPNIDPVEDVFGITAVGRGGTRVVATGSGRAIMLDAGYGGGVNYAVYEAQLQNLLSEMGVESINSIVITHPHSDHVTALEEIIARENIRASELIIGGQFQYNRDLQNRLRNLANNESTRLLGYHRWDFARQFEGARPGEYSVLAPINNGRLRISFFASEGAINNLNAKVENGTIKASDVDAASILAKIESIGGELRMIVLGDLRGKDYLELERSMEASNPGSFMRLFQNVNVLSGMQHHLGRINDMQDFQGIMRVLEVTAGRMGEVSVLVQTKGGGAQEVFANALSRMGATVYWTGTPGEGNLSGLAVAKSSSEIATSGQVGIARMSSNESEMLTRIATISNLKYGTDALISDSPRLMNDTQFANLRQKILEAFEEIIRLYRQRGNLTFGKLVGKTESQASNIQLSEAELTANMNAIMRQRPVDQILEENVELKETVNFMINTMGRAAEIEQELELMRTTGRSNRLVELIHAASPQYARAILRSNPNITAVRFFTLLEQQAELNRIANTMGGGGGGRMSRAGAGILAVLVLAHDVILPAVVAFRSRNTRETNEAWNIVLWWYEKGIIPDMIGYMGDKEITDKAELATLLSKGKLDGFSMTGLSSDNWQRFRLWLSANVLNFEDYNRYFIADPVIVYSRTGDSISTSKWSLKLPTYDDGFTIKEVENEEFTDIMNVTADEMSRNTNIELDQLFENSTRKKEMNVTPTFSAKVEPSTDSMPIGTVNWGNYTIFYEPKKRLRFKSGSNKEVYSFYDSDQKEIDSASWWKKNTDIVLFEVSLPEPLKHWGTVPSGYKLVMGGNYNTYAQLKIEYMSQYSKYPPVEMPGKRFDGAFWVWDDDDFSKEQKDAYQRHQNDPLNVKMNKYGNIKNMGYVVTFPGNSANWHGLVLVKSDDVE